MSTKTVHSEMTEMFGVVPEFIKSIPEHLIDAEWELFKKVQVEENHLPNKYKELIGLGIAAATKCKYCTYFHTKFAKLNGATDEEIQEAVHYAKSGAGWSTYINGTQQDYNKFCKEVDQIYNNVSKMAAQAR